MGDIIASEQNGLKLCTQSLDGAATDCHRATPELLDDYPEAPTTEIEEVSHQHETLTEQPNASATRELDTQLEATVVLDGDANNFSPRALDVEIEVGAGSILDKTEIEETQRVKSWYFSMGLGIECYLGLVVLVIAVWLFATVYETRVHSKLVTGGTSSAGMPAQAENSVSLAKPTVALPSGKDVQASTDAASSTSAAASTAASEGQVSDVFGAGLPALRGFPQARNLDDADVMVGHKSTDDVSPRSSVCSTLSGQGGLPPIAAARMLRPGSNADVSRLLLWRHERSRRSSSDFSVEDTIGDER